MFYYFISISGSTLQLLLAVRTHSSQPSYLIVDVLLSNIHYWMVTLHLIGTITGFHIYSYIIKYIWRDVTHHYYTITSDKTNVVEIFFQRFSSYHSAISTKPPNLQDFLAHFNGSLSVWRIFFYFLPTYIFLSYIFQEMLNGLSSGNSQVARHKGLWLLVNWCLKIQVCRPVSGLTFPCCSQLHISRKYRWHFN